MIIKNKIYITVVGLSKKNDDDNILSISMPLFVVINDKNFNKINVKQD